MLGFLPYRFDDPAQLFPWSDRLLDVAHLETAVGAHILRGAHASGFELSWWREANCEVDFVMRKGRSLVAIEVKSGRRRDGLPGLDLFARRHPATRRLMVGADGIDLEDFLLADPECWFSG